MLWPLILDFKRVNARSPRYTPMSLPWQPMQICQGCLDKQIWSDHVHKPARTVWLKDLIWLLSENSLQFSAFCCCSNIVFYVFRLHHSPATSLRMVNAVWLLFYKNISPVHSQLVFVYTFQMSTDTEMINSPVLPEFPGTPKPLWTSSIQSSCQFFFETRADWG